MKPKVIAFGCIARVGKDSCAAILEKYLQCSTFSFAQELKKALDPLCKEFHGISAFTQNDEEKKIIRPLMVEFGNSVRKVNHRTWIEKVKHKMDMQDCLRVYKEAYILTDLRFHEFENDEFGFVKNELKGLVINVDRLLPNGELMAPANKSEERNYHKIKSEADICLVASNLEDLEAQLVEKVIPLVRKVSVPNE